MRVTIEFEGVRAKIKKIAHNDKVGYFMASEAERLMSPYVPMDTGMLYQNTVIEPWKVTYTQNYASRVYKGDRLNFSKEKHPLATSHWDVAMKASRGHELANSVTQYLKRL